MIDFTASILVILLNRILSIVPIGISLWIGRRIGTVIFFFNKKRRMIAYANLKAALGKEKTPRELRCITKRVYQNMAQTFVEILNLTKLSKRYVDTYVEIIHFERVKRAIASDRGLILLTGHFGNWELSSLVGGITGFPMAVLAREQKMKRLNELLNRLRESKGCKVIRKGISTKHIIRALYAKDIVGILSDQDAGKSGIFCDFFGRPASTPPGVMEIAKRTGAVILPNFIVRTKGPYHKLYCEDYIDFKNGPSADVKENLQRFMTLLESFIRKYPDQWLWMHKRWKSTPVRTVLVLSDGKQGHVNQSLAVARQIQRSRHETQGYAIDDTKIVVCEVSFRSRTRRALLAAASLGCSWRCHGCMKCMRFCLTEDAYRRLMGMYCDFVVSCGSSLAPVNVFVAAENNAKNIVIMSPRTVGLRRFDLAVIPRHDRPPIRRNVVVTDAAPNLVDGQTLAYFSGRLRERARLTDGTPKVGLLLGGDTDGYTMSEQIVRTVMETITASLDRFNAEILVTTSRRTPHVVESFLKERLSGDPRCKVLVVANEENPEGTVEGILGSSDVVVVSGESISMVSEAIQSKRPVIAFELAKKSDASTKHERALRGLASRGFLEIARPEDVGQRIAAALTRRSDPPVLNDTEKIFEAVRRII